MKVFSSSDKEPGHHRQIFVEKVFSGSSTSSVKMIEDDSPEMVFDDPLSPPPDERKPDGFNLFKSPENSPIQPKSGSKVNSSNPF